MSTPVREVSLDERAASDAPMPIQAPNDPYVCAFHRENWMVRSDGRVVPALIPIPMVPGINGIGERQRTVPLQMWDTIVKQNRGRGKLLLHPNWRPEGRPHAVVGTPVRDPIVRGATGTFFHMAWETPRPSTSTIDVDLAAWDAYLECWASHDLPLTPDSDVVDARVAELTRRYERALAREDGRETARSRSIARDLAAWAALQPKAALPTAAEPRTVAPAAPKPPKPAKAGPVSLPEPSAVAGDAPVDAAGNGFAPA